MGLRYIYQLKSGRGAGTALARGSVKTLAVRTSGALLALFMQLSLARALGVTEYGIFVYASSWLMVLAMFSRLGMDTGLTRLVAEYRAKEAWGDLLGVLRWAIKNSLLLGAVVGAIAALVTWALRDGVPEGQLQTLWVAFLVIPILSLTMLRQGALRGFRRVVHAELPEMVLRPLIMLFVLGLGIAMDWRFEAVEVMGFTLLAYFLAFLIGSWWLRKALAENVPAVSVVMASAMWWKVAAPLVLMQGMQLILARLDILMLGTMQGPDSAGVYGATIHLAALVAFGLNVVNPIAAPLFSELFHTERKEELQRVVTLAARFTTAVTLVAAVFLVFFGKWVLGLFGGEFAAGYVALLILLCGQLVNALSGSVGYLMTMTGHQNAAAMILGAAATANVILNYLLIPRYGIEGAAVATAITIAGWNIAMVVYVRVKIGIRSTVV